MQIGKGLRLIGMQGEAVSGWGLFILAHYASGVTFPLGYSNGQGLYLPTSGIISEGGYEVESYHEYWFSSGLESGFEEILQGALDGFAMGGVH